MRERVAPALGVPMPPAHPLAPMRLLLLAAALAAAPLAAQPVPDVAFSGDGFTAPIEFPVVSQVDIAVDAQGRALVAADIQISGQPATGVVTRLGSNGEPDEFGGARVVTIPVDPSETVTYLTTDRVVAVLDGRIAVTGQASIEADSVSRFVSFVAMFLPDGRPDPSFGTGGVAQLPFSERIYAVAAAADGLYLGGRSGEGRATVARVLYSGMPDPDFGDGGIAKGPNGLCAALSIRPDGRILAAGGTSATSNGSLDILLFSLLPSGLLDETFAGDGVMTEDLFGENDIALGLTLLPDGRAIVSGQASKRGNTEYGTLLYLVGADGTPDAGFGFEGWAWTDVRLNNAETGGYETPGQPYALAGGGFGVLVGGVHVPGFAALGLAANGNPLASYGPRGVTNLFENQPRLLFTAAVGSGDVAYASGIQASADGTRRAFVARILLSAPTASELGLMRASGLAVAPNPVARMARVTVTLAETAHAAVRVVDALGRTVAMLHDGPLAAGDHVLALDASGLPAGVYAVVATAGGTQRVTRVTIVR